MTIQLLNTKDLAKHLKCTTRSIQNWCAIGRIPVIRVSRRCIRFDLGEVESALRNPDFGDLRDDEEEVRRADRRARAAEEALRFLESDPLACWSIGISNQAKIRIILSMLKEAS